MSIIYFLNGLSFGGLGLAAYLTLRQGGEFPLGKQLPWLAVFGFACGATSWVDMFAFTEMNQDLQVVLAILRMVLQPLTGLLLLKFGWGILKNITPLPAWTIFIPGVLIVPVAYVITYASTTFVTPSPIEIPIDIWSRYLFYLPGSVLAGVGFLRQWAAQRQQGYLDVSKLMLGAGLAFLFEAVVVGLIVPAAPHAPASYYNYDRVIYNAFSGEQAAVDTTYGLTSWLDYQRVLETTGLPIQFWRMLSSFAVTFFVVRGLGVFDAIRKRQMQALQTERDLAQKAAFEGQIVARQTAESWTDALVSISRSIAELDNVDNILLCIVENARRLLHADFIGLAILDEDMERLELKCYSKEDHIALVDFPLRVDSPLIWNSMQSAQQFRSHGAESTREMEGLCFFDCPPARAVAIVRLNLDNRPIGALWIARFSKDLFSDTDLIWLYCLADQVVIAIQHGLMTTQLQSLSIIEERARIAREMHDGLAQILGYLNLQVQTLEALHRQDKREKFLLELNQMRQAIQTANADVRENILSLRTTLANEKGLISAVGEYLTEFGIQTGVETEFTNRVEGDLNLSSVAEVQLVCILQEALTNVRKHALAGRVDVLIEKRVEGSNHSVYMKVIDDGSGFTSYESRRSFGLQTMRERAQSVGGALTIQSNAQRGTMIECCLPCLEPEKLKKQSLVFSK
jgi:signal transduction histidine kinase